MTTSGRVPTDAMVDLMSGGDEAEALFEAWLAEGPPRGPLPPVRVVNTPPDDAADAVPDPGPAVWREPLPRPSRPR
ncbi:hypothetical protein [Rubrivivax gelatinosus]|uniref:Uncharacterized protein n=1 Tax=Rubrivivax gelatinosus TaxID=28068 RepID=A0A4R2M5B4_RUBGE|nr:hypothetical protein [Rubrivivax gelatinosus]MBK1688009.1 hypothetical protein [Rubrivivax gelatinosus]TCO99293.1 hypothetical protein EV684_11586 [Rubrivivax gelatinosus]